MLHQPTFSYSLPHPLFLMLKNMCLIEKNMLHLSSKSLIDDIPCLKAKQITNKIGQNITISRMVDVLALVEYGMKVS
jgi:hypothetical protein